jgi:hypothetical protein
MQSSSGLKDAIQASLDMARALPRDGFGIVGYGICHLMDGDGQTKLVVPFANLITDQGDLWYAGKGIASIPPASPSAPTALTGMQIGSGTTAVSKAGAGSAMVTLLAGQAFDATYPSTNNLGTTLGVEAVYKTTYAAGTGTGTVNEATITHGTIGTASTAANTISRVLTGAITKGASDSLAITWRHKFLGA